MLAVLFEVQLQPGQQQAYLDAAAALRAELEQLDGFISIERFSSLSDTGKVLSLSFWRDEEAVETWRTQADHRIAQSRGRADIFRDYRIRIASVVRDYGMRNREQAPADNRAIHG